MSTTTRPLSVWCTDGKHLDCAASEVVCQCSCHGDTRRRPSSIERTGFGKPGGMPAARPPEAKPSKPSATGARRARTPRPRLPAAAPRIIRKEDAPCCAATRDALGRYCIGFCSTTCIRRPKRTP